MTRQAGSPSSHHPYLITFVSSPSSKLSPRRRLQRLARHRLQQPLAIELELLRLELALLRVDLALCADPGVRDARRQCVRLAPQELVAVRLLELELLLLQTLLEIELIEPPRVGGREVVAARAQALLEVQIERVLLLAELKLAARAVGGRARRRSSRARERDATELAGEIFAHFDRTLLRCFGSGEPRL